MQRGPVRALRLSVSGCFSSEEVPGYRALTICKLHAYANAQHRFAAGANLTRSVRR
jgi:hypothetical protein